MSDVSDPRLADAVDKLTQLRSELRKVVVGQETLIEEMLIVLIARGHALLEGVPGTAKTLAVRGLGAAMTCDVKRIQFTPDLMPSDVVGTNVFNLSSSAFELRRGPIFTDLLLADEINRSPAKTQAALLEAMAEGQTTIDGQTHRLSPVFTVFATQNPVEFEGTYPLPEAQQDRFLLKIKVGYPSEEAEMDVIRSAHSGKPYSDLSNGRVQPIFSRQTLREAQELLPLVRVDDGILQYILKIVRATRGHESVQLGAGPRGSLYLLLASKARALVSGFDYVRPDDVVALVPPVLGHRLTLRAEAEISGTTTEEVLQSILDKVEVPR